MKSSLSTYAPRTPHAPLRIAGFVLLSAIFLYFATAYISRPGLEYDEVLFGNAAMNDPDPHMFREYDWTWHHHHVPIMLMRYIGAPKAWFYYWLFRLVEPSALTIRLPMILLAVGSLWLSWAIATRLFGPLAGWCTTLLLATDPSFIFQSKLDWGPVTIMIFTKLAALWLLLRQGRTRNALSLITAGFFLGLGLFDKANFIWFLAALPAAAFLIWPRRVVKNVRPIPVLAIALGFVLGSAPFLIYNLATAGGTFQGSVHGMNELLARVSNKISVLRGTLSGNGVYDFTMHAPLPPYFTPQAWLSGIDFTATLTPVYLLICSIMILCLARVAPFPQRRQAAFVLLLAALLQAAIFATFEATGPHHVMILYPFTQMIIAYVLVAAGQWISRHPMLRRLRAGSAFLLLTLGWLVLSNVVVDAKYVHAYAQTGGRGIWSDRIVDLVAFLRAHPEKHPLLMDWGLATQTLLLSHAKIDPPEPFWSLLDPQNADINAEALLPATIDPASVFIFHAPEFQQFKASREAFTRMLTRHHMHMEPLTIILQRDHHPVYELMICIPDQPQQTTTAP